MMAQAYKILTTFAAKMRKLGAKTLYVLGDNPELALDYIDQVTNGR